MCRQSKGPRKRNTDIIFELQGKKRGIRAEQKKLEKEIEDLPPDYLPEGDDLIRDDVPEDKTSKARKTIQNLLG